MCGKNAPDYIPTQRMLKILLGQPPISFHGVDRSDAPTLFPSAMIRHSHGPGTPASTRPLAVSYEAASQAMRSARSNAFALPPAQGWQMLRPCRQAHGPYEKDYGWTKPIPFGPRDFRSSVDLQIKFQGQDTLLPQPRTRQREKTELNKKSYTR